MPMYEFACSACGQEFEELQTVHDQTVPPCPACGSVKTRKLISSHCLKSGASPLDGMDKMRIMPGLRKGTIGNPGPGGGGCGSGGG